MTEPGGPSSAHDPAAREESSWRDQNENIFSATVLAAAEQLGVQPLAVEKDYWVCQALRAIEVHAPGQVIFKGGTSLGDSEVRAFLTNRARAAEVLTSCIEVSKPSPTISLRRTEGSPPARPSPRSGNTRRCCAQSTTKRWQVCTTARRLR